MAKRSSSKRLRFEIFKRDNFTCQYCGRTPPAIILEVDHIVPVSKGGGNEQINLLTACFDCNRGKSSTPLEVIPVSLETQIQEQKDRRKQVSEYNKFLLAIRKDQDKSVSNLGRYWCNFFKEKDMYECGGPAVTTLKRFLSFLTEAEIMNAMDIAHSMFPVKGDYDAKTFRYFCGICWKSIRSQNGED